MENCYIGWKYIFHHIKKKLKFWIYCAETALVNLGGNFILLPSSLDLRAVPVVLVHLRRPCMKTKT
jgi:hypothetical protein